MHKIRKRIIYCKNNCNCFCDGSMHSFYVCQNKKTISNNNNQIIVKPIINKEGEIYFPEPKHPEPQNLPNPKTSSDEKLFQAQIKKLKLKISFLKKTNKDLLFELNIKTKGKLTK